MSATETRSLKPWIVRVAEGERLSAADTAEAFDIMMSGEATPSQIGAFLMGLRVRGETVEEIAGGASAMRARALPIQASRGGRRCRRYRRRRVGQPQRLDRRGDRGRRGRRAGGEARQPGDVVAMRFRRRARRARRCDRLRPRAGAAHARRSRAVLHAGAPPPRGHAPCRADAAGDGHPNDLQPSWPVVQPGGRAARDDGSLRGALGRAARARARPARGRARLGRAW